MASHSSFRRALLLAFVAWALWGPEGSIGFLAGPGRPPSQGPSAPPRRSAERGAGLGAGDAAPLEAESSIPEEILAGISVAFSLLSKAIACSAIVGTGPLVGLWSSVAMGFSSLIGMRPGVVAGSAAVVVVPLGAFAATNGLALVPLVVLLAAIIEFVAGLAGFARTLDLVSKEVLAGFLNALGLALLVSQSAALSTPMGFGLAIICAALTQFLPSAPIPSSLVGLAVATAVGFAFNFDVPTLAMKAKDPTAFAGGLAALPQLQLPQLPSMDDVALALPCAISIAFISLIETLLAARVVDDRKCEDLCTFFYDENGELVQGSDPETPLSVDVPTSTVLSLAAGNGASVLLGGFGGAGLVPQTVLNLNSGGRSQWSTGSYAASMVMFALVLAPLVGQISVPALAGIMVQVSLDTIQFVPTFDAIKAALEGKEEDSKVRLAILAITAVLCYQVDFAVGIVTGVALDKGAEALKLKKTS